MKGYLLMIPYLLISLATSTFLAVVWLISMVRRDRSAPPPKYKARSIIGEVYDYERHITGR